MKLVLPMTYHLQILWIEKNPALKGAEKNAA